MFLLCARVCDACLCVGAWPQVCQVSFSVTLPYFFETRVSKRLFETQKEKSVLTRLASQCRDLPLSTGTTGTYRLPGLLCGCWVSTQIHEYTANSPLTGLSEMIQTMAIASLSREAVLTADSFLKWPQIFEGNLTFRKTTVLLGGAQFRNLWLFYATAAFTWLYGVVIAMRNVLSQSVLSTP